MNQKPYFSKVRGGVFFQKFIKYHRAQKQSIIGQTIDLVERDGCLSTAIEGGVPFN